jgi:hypothetical protein
MSGYTGRLQSSAGSTSAYKVAKADRATPSGSLNGKLLLIAAYVHHLAHHDHGGDVANVPCPSSAEWARLSCGHDPALPSSTLLALYANDAIRDQVQSTRSGLSYREVYWEVARKMALRRQSAN